MKHQALTMNPAVKILHRKGVIFASRLSGTAPPVQLLDFDLVLFSQFLQPTTPDVAIDSISKGPVRSLLATAPSTHAMLGRIHELTQAGFLFDEPVQFPAPDGDLRNLRENPVGERVLPTTQQLFRMGANMALQPVAGGFACWSPACRQWFMLDLRLCLQLFSFLNPIPVGQAIASNPHLGSEPELQQGFALLMEAGLLVESDAQTQKRVQAERARGAPVITATKLNGPRWEDIAVDSRIPVYFTPHMENHYPLALGMIATAINVWDEGNLLQRFHPMPIAYLRPQQLFEGIFRKFGPGVWLFSSYIWSMDLNLKIANALKSMDPRNLTVFGGPSVPGYPQACTDFMNQNPAVDVAVHGEGEIAVTELLEKIGRADDGAVTFDPQALREVQGITFRDCNVEGSLVTTESRTRLKAPDSIPSPYLTGVFDSYDGAVEAAIIESDRGCPFGCTFCDWGSATRQKVRKFEVDRVKQEIEWIGRNKVRVIWIANANFGMYDRDIELSQFIVETKQKYGFPQEVVVNYTKNTTRRLVEIIKAFSAGGIISQGIISIQTTDEKTLEVINRRNIKTDKYDELTQVFADADLPLSTDLMIGLPGITPEAFDRDLQRYLDVDVSTKAYPTQLLPNSPMADPEYMEKYQIRVDENDFVISCTSFNEQEWAGMKAIFNVFMVADGYSTLRYVLRYLQWDHNIRAMDFLHRLLEEITLDPERYAHITWAMKFFITDKFMPGGWKGFYDDIARLAHDCFGVERDSAFNAVLRVNELAMPDDVIEYPCEISLEHDFVAWFKHHNGNPARELRALSDYGPGEFQVDDPDSMASIDMDYIQYDSHQYFWELRSATARAKSVSDARLNSEAAVDR